MKRSKTSSRAMRARTDDRDRDGDSAYAQKVKRGDQMFGTGDKRTNCCAHRIKLSHWSG
jgi:hypothetical protein